MKNQIEGFLVRAIKTPLGRLEFAVNNQGLFQYIEFQPYRDGCQSTNYHQHENLDLAECLLKEYFLGKQTQFDKLLPLLDFKGTAFQKMCWQALLQISYGETWTYGQQARMIDKPKAVRAVGAANGKNVFAIVVPCHRVIGASGSLTGYAGGLDKKQYLLNLERAI